MEFPEDDDSPARYITRTGELVRTLGHTYEYWHRGRPGVTATRWLVEDKKIPERTISAEEFRERVLAKLEEWVPDGPGMNLRTAAWEVCTAVAETLAREMDVDWEGVSFSRFQLESTLRILEARYRGNTGNRAQVLTAGVGSGKTIGFSIAVLIEARKSMLDASHSRNSDHLTISLFVYPRTQLCKNQHQAICEFTSNMRTQPSDEKPEGEPIPLEPWLELSETYENDEGLKYVTSGVVKKYGDETLPMPVIVTTYETLKRRMRRPEFMKKISNHLSTVVLDEIHLTSGVSGGMAAYLLSRLTAATKGSDREVYWIGASATIAQPDEHAARLFGIRPEEVGVVDPREDELVQDGVNHHVFIRPNPGMSPLGVLVNTTSNMLHQRRDDILRERDGDGKQRSKSIGFADNLEMLGRWNDDLRENERTANEAGQWGKPSIRKHAKSSDTSSWTPKQRELPYALRFHKPLQRRLTSKGGDDSERRGGVPGDALADLSALFNSEAAATVCDSCMSGEKVILGEIGSEHLKELSKLVHRHPHKEDDPFKAFRIESKEFKLHPDSAPIPIGSHNLCPMLRAGACAWFPQPDPEEVTPIPPSSFEFASSALSTVFSAKSDKESEAGDSLASFVFEEELELVYDEGTKGVRVPVDIVLASPSLEVGVDLPKLTESVMHKAVRNIASYRQKAGRVGRESNLEIFNLSLMTDTNVDLHYYRQPRKLVSEGRLEPVPLMDENRAIKACSAYGAVWEWLALNSPLPEWIKHDNGRDAGNEQISRILKFCRLELDSSRGDVVEHVHVATKRRLETDDRGQEIIADAIKQVLEEIDLLLLPACSTYKVHPDPGFDYKVIDLFAMQRSSSSEWGGGVPTIKKRLDGLEDSDIDDMSDSEEKPMSAVNMLVEEIRRLRPERLIEDHRELFEEIHDLQYLLRSKTLTTEESRKKIQAIQTLGGSVEDFQIEAQGIFFHLSRIFQILKRMEEVDFNPRVESMFEDYKKLEPQVQAYLSESIEGLSLIKHNRRDSWFVRPSTLFENPYSPEVDLYVMSVNKSKAQPLGAFQNKVKLHEALFAFQPGTWTHRIPHRRLKVRTGHLTPEGGRLVATLREMTAAGNEFRPVNPNSLPAPPGSPDKVRVWAPTRLALISMFDKYAWLDKTTEKILDNDEQTGRGDGDEEDEDHTWDKPKKVKIPRTFANRWTYCEPGQGEGVGVFRLKGHKYTEEFGGSPVKEREMDVTEINHPLGVALLDSIEWHDELDVIEYTYSNSRSYSSAGDVELAYQDEHGRTVAFGEEFTTEGFSLVINSDSVDKMCRKIEREMVDGEGVSTPSLIKAFKAHVSSDTEHGGAAINPYSLDDLISVLLIHAEWGGAPISLEAWMGMVTEAGSADEIGMVREIAEEYYKKKMKLVRALSDDELDEDEEGDNMAATRAGVLIEALDTVNRGIDGFGGGLRLWAHRTVLSTFGSTASSALQRFSGSDDNDMGYLIEPDSWDGNGSRVTVYDRAQYGNGSCATARQYMHIPHVLRYTRNADKSKLPTTDYLSTLEEGLLQCMQHQSDLGALTIHEEGDEGMIEHLPDLKNHSREICDVGSETWGRIGVSGAQDAWSLPLHRRLAVHYEATFEGDEEAMYADDVTRACTSCWNGCPECVDQIRNTLGGFRGLDFIDKYVLDSWFTDSVAESDDYGIYRFGDIGTGAADMHLGSLNKVHLVAPDDYKLRSICLPWTMGFLTPRTGSMEPRLIMRHSDVSGMRIGESSGTAEGIESHGFRRLMWFNLLMTGHLDSVGAIRDDRTKEDPHDHDKKIKLLYFDIRDISFQDVGLSPRMLDSMAAVSDGANLEKLSDVLRWMLKRGFEVELCIDRMRASEARVLDFLTAIGEWDNLSIRAMPPEFGGNMHKKILISPIAAMSGSANLTHYGTEFSQESISHTMRYNDTQYKSLQASSRTTFSQAPKIDLSNIARAEYRGNRPGRRAVNAPLSPIDSLAEKLSAGDLGNEDLLLEYKPFLTKVSGTIPNGTWKDTVDIVFKEIASMLNTEGGFVVVGVRDPMNDLDSEDFTIIGIDDEIEDQGGLDQFMVKITGWMKNAFGLGVSSSLLRSEIRDINGKSVLIFQVEPCKEFIAYLKPLGGAMKSKHRMNGYGNDGAIYVRSNDSGMLLEAGGILSWNSLRFSD